MATQATHASVHIHVRDIENVTANTTLDHVSLGFGSGFCVFLYGSLSEQRAMVEKLTTEARNALAVLEAQATTEAVPA